MFIGQPAVAKAAGHDEHAILIASTDRLQFFSDPWINLHHFLYQWARGEEQLAKGRDYVAVPERDNLDVLSEDQKAAWLQALGFYRQSIAARDRFQDEMLELKSELVKLDGDFQATPTDVITGVSEALSLAMPVYRQVWWPQHDRANRQWAKNVIPIVDRHEERYVTLTTQIYNAKWSENRRRVDVSAYANPRAGYTARGHVVIYSTDPGNQAMYGVETVFHEIQHTRAMGSFMRAELRERFREAELEPPRNLWHSLIFMTAGTFTRSVAESEGLSDHIPYWTREGFANFRGWQSVVPLVTAHWGPVVDGKSTRDEAIAAMIAALGEPPP